MTDRRIKGAGSGRKGHSAGASAAFRRSRRRILTKLSCLLLLSVFILTRSFSHAAGEDERFPYEDPFIRSSTEYEEQTLPFYYSDAFFAGNAEEMDWGLADVSLVMAMSSGKPEILQNLYENMGFTDIRMNEDYTGTPHADTIGLMAARKRIRINGEPCSLVALSIRGINYLAEWAGNLMIGADGSHAGFSHAAGKAQQFLGEYLESVRRELGEEEPVKLWIQGYSRAGAVAYMTAKAVMDSGLLPKEAVYTYCFSAPDGAADESQEANIHILVGSMDYVQKILPAEWGLRRNGTVITIGSMEEADSLRSVFTGDEKPVYGVLDQESGQMIPERFEVRKLDFQALLKGKDGALSLSEKHKDDYDLNSFHEGFLDFLMGRKGKDLLNTISDLGFRFTVPAALEDRTVYHETYEEALSYVLEFLFSLPEEKREAFLHDVVKNEKRVRSLVTAFLTDISLPEQNYGGLKFAFIERTGTIGELKALMQESGLSEEAESLDEEKTVTVLRLLGKLVRLDQSNHEFTYMATFFGNIEYILKGHKPETLLAWIRKEHPETYVSIVADNADPGLGSITGECAVPAGTTVHLSASPFDEFSAFDGWFNDRSVISRNPDYSFKLEKDRCYTAHFHSLHVSGVTLDRHELHFTETGATRQLTAVLTPKDALINGVRFESDRPEVVRVDADGSITVLAEGTAVITVHTEEGDFTDSCTIEVVLPTEEPETSEEETATESEESQTESSPESEEESREEETEPAGEHRNRMLTSILPPLFPLAAAAGFTIYSFFRKRKEEKSHR